MAGAQSAGFTPMVFECFLHFFTHCLIMRHLSVEISSVVFFFYVRVFCRKQQIDWVKQKEQPEGLGDWSKRGEKVVSSFTHFPEWRRFGPLIVRASFGWEKPSFVPVVSQGSAQPLKKHSQNRKIIYEFSESFFFCEICSCNTFSFASECTAF